MCRGSTSSWWAPAIPPGQAVLNFANQNAHVTQLVRGDRLSKSMSAYLIDRIERAPADRRPPRDPG